MKVFVADGAMRSSLSIVRSLGSKGIEVDVGETYRHSTSALSRYCAKSYVYPDPRTSTDEFIQWLMSLVENGDYSAIYATTEAVTLPICYHKERLEHHTRVPFPGYEQLMLTHDKGKTLRIAQNCGVRTPRTVLSPDISDLTEAADTFEFPVVVRSRCKNLWLRGKFTTMNVAAGNYVFDKDALIRQAEAILSQTGAMPLVQEYIPGTGYGVELLLCRGEPRAIFMHRRLREYPITGGASTLREGIYSDALREPAVTLMQNLNWHGLAMVEFKVDSRDGTPYLMEVNGRFWGSLPLAVLSGVDFPYLLHKMIIEGDIPPGEDYRTGLRSRWLIPGDIAWCATSLLRRQNRLSTLRDFFNLRDLNDDIIAWNDILPTFGAMMGASRDLTRVLFR
ncbi:carboxylate--amine ligase [Methanoculleus horonobensis]|uniref:carboxylate--amine ligase n=1 Tax=Methanoculleus horonobensis TaxID=528314 RepID=UPI000AB6BB84|nr:ATP-grasp domain-containing protein [Methanoculleus horonobensis]